MTGEGALAKKGEMSPRSPSKCIDPTLHMSDIPGIHNRSPRGQNETLVFTKYRATLIAQQLLIISSVSFRHIAFSVCARAISPSVQFLSTKTATLIPMNKAL